jgi:transposase
MTLDPQLLPPVPEATVAAVQEAFPKGNLYVVLRSEFGALYDDQLFGGGGRGLQRRPAEPR